MRILSVAVLTSLSQLPAAGAAALPEEYAVTDITGWSAEQLSTPPSFDRYTLAGAQSLSTPTQVSPAVLPASP